MSPRQLLAWPFSFLLSRGARSAEKLGDGARVPDGADGNLIDGAVGRGQRVGYAVQLPDQGDPAGQDLVGSPADPLDRGEHPVEQRDDDGQYHDQQDGVAYPPQDHGSFSSAGGLVGGEEPAEYAAERHHRGAQADREALRLGGGRGELLRGLAALGTVDTVVQVDG